MAKVLFTGGGSAGHVTPNLALMESMQAKDWEVMYVGSKTGIEKEIVGRTKVPYFAISTGKLRRYFSWANFVDPLRILLGFVQALGLCFKHKPHLVFSKGGFVSVPVVLAAWILRIPVIAHESDVTPGLATRICLPFCKYLCVNFEQTLNNHPKVIVTGSPVRQDVLQGDPDKGRKYLDLNNINASITNSSNINRDLPVLLVFGGSLGATSINQRIYSCLDRLLKDFRVVHICGEGNLRAELSNYEGYCQKEYIHKEFGDVLACSDLVVARAGANSLYELLMARKPNILIPLSLQGSRGDQIVNAETFRKAGYSHVIQEHQLTDESLMAAIHEVFASREQILNRLSEFETRDSVSQICDLMISSANSHN